ncbi:translocation/assembly module TamB domain-containing protein, partial [bacterium]|nr:translocation/assembly module TamB domain-containing protein [bacterium]
MILRIARWTFMLFVFALCWAGTKTWQNEKLDLWLNEQIKHYAKNNFPISATVTDVELRLVPPLISFKKVSIQPQEVKLKSILEPTLIKNISIRPSLLHLLIGRIHLANIELTGSNIDITYTNEPSQEELKIELEKILQQIPVTQLKIEDFKVTGKIKNGNDLIKFKLSPINTTLTNDLNNLLAKIKIDDLHLTFNEKEVLKKTFFETHFFLTEKNFVLSDFKIKEGDAFVVASGSTQHSLKQKKVYAGKLNIRAFMNAKYISELIKPYLQEPINQQLALISGSLKTDLRLDIQDIKTFDIETKTIIYGLQYDNFKIGDIDINGVFNNAKQNFKVNEIKFKNSGLAATIDKSDFSTSNLSFSNMPITISHFSLNPYLKYSIGKDIPAHVEVAGKTVCSGNLDPFKIECTAQADAKNTNVNPNPERPIIEIKDTAKLSGNVTINAKEVTYKANIDLGHSKGDSDGIINFKSGFNINYNTSALNLSSIKKIAGLEIGGTAQIRGSTSGNSSAAIFDLQFDGKDILFEKYKLGEISHNLKYAKGNLYVQKIQGAAASTRYLGNLQIDFIKDIILGKIQFPFIDLTVMQESIKENLKLPIDLAGSGSAVVQLESPLDPNKLSFKGKARLYNCKIDQQHIETIDLDVTSTLGKLKINTALFEEKNSTMNLNGLIHLDKKEFELTFQSQKMYLDDIVYTTKYSTPTKGLFSSQGRIQGPFQSPNIDFSFLSDNFFLANKKIAPLQGKVLVYSNKTSAEIFGPNDFKFIFRDTHGLPDYHIEGITKKFDIAPLITSLIEIPQIDDFKIIVSSNFNLKIPRENPHRVSGYVFFPELTLETEKNQLSTEKEISLFFTNGKVNFSTFNLKGTGGKLQVKSKTTPFPLDIQLSGLFSLSFLHLFTPFLETIEGQTTVNMNIQKNESSVNFFGSAFIDNGYIKLPEIQHAIENLKIDLLFNQDRININSLKSKFASGQMTGDGSIRLLGAKNIPLDLNLHLDNIDLNIPPQVNTIGTADLKLTGSWLPFELSGKYKVIDGLISKEFSSDDTEKVNAHEIFLPSTLRNKQTSPINLNLEILPTVPLKIKNSLVDG